MKISIQREDLLKPLQLVSGAIERRQTLPILANVLLSVDETQLSLVGSDLEIQLLGRVKPLNIIEQGEITVNARKLMDICRTLPNNAIIDLNAEKNRLVVQSGKSRFTLSTLSASEFPIVEENTSAFEVNLPQDKLKNLLEKTYFAMGLQDVRYYLNGMLFYFGNNQLRLVATDGHRLSLTELSDVEMPSKGVQSIVPRKGVLELIKLLDGQDAGVKISIGSNHICAVSENFTITSKLIEGKFPDYDTVIPKNGNKEIIINREAFKQALMRVSILSHEKYRGVRLLITPDLMKIFTNNPEQEEAEEEVAVDYKGAELEIGFNVDYLLDVCNVIPDEEMHLLLADSGSSLLIEDKTNNTYVYVVMPMRI